MPKELLVNVSEYEAPQPFEEVIQVLGQMKVGEYIRMLHRKKPLPLFQFLQENGYDYKVGTFQSNYHQESSKKNIRINDVSNNVSNDKASNNSVLWEIVIWNKKDAFVNDYCLNAF